SLLAADHKLMPHSGRSLPDAGKRKLRVPDLLKVPGRDLAALLLAFLYMTQTDAQKPCLQLVQSGIGSHDLIIIPFLASVIAEHTEVLGQPLVLYDHAAPVSEGADILGRVE